jgi:hypothetical protein
MTQQNDLIPRLHDMPAALLCLRNIALCGCCASTLLNQRRLPADLTHAPAMGSHPPSECGLSELAGGLGVGDDALAGEKVRQKSLASSPIPNTEVDTAVAETPRSGRITRSRQGVDGDLSRSMGVSRPTRIR